MRYCQLYQVTTSSIPEQWAVRLLHSQDECRRVLWTDMLLWESVFLFVLIQMNFYRIYIHTSFTQTLESVSVLIFSSSLQDMTFLIPACFRLVLVWRLRTAAVKVWGWKDGIGCPIFVVGFCLRIVTVQCACRSRRLILQVRECCMVSYCKDQRKVVKSNSFGLITHKLMFYPQCSNCNIRKSFRLKEWYVHILWGLSAGTCNSKMFC